MQLGKIRGSSGETVVVLVDDGHLFQLDMGQSSGIATLADVLHAPNPLQTAKSLVNCSLKPEPLGGQVFLPPVDRQEIWAAGVTYKRSKIAREEESKGAAQFYDKVYTAARPELFLKATSERAVGPHHPIRVRADSKWNVPEPELALVVSPDLRIVGYTIGNDVSSRDIEGENPLYLPQAKVYKNSCSVGPWITLADKMPALPGVEIRLIVHRAGAIAFEGTTSLSQMARTPEDLVQWLGRDNEFPHGVLLLTGTGIVPPDSFNLTPGDTVDISIAGIGTLSNPVE